LKQLNSEPRPSLLQEHMVDIRELRNHGMFVEL